MTLSGNVFSPWSKITTLHLNCKSPRSKKIVMRLKPLLRKKLFLKMPKILKSGNPSWMLSKINSKNSTNYPTPNALLIALKNITLNPHFPIHFLKILIKNALVPLHLPTLAKYYLNYLKQPPPKPIAMMTYWQQSKHLNWIKAKTLSWSALLNKLNIFTLNHFLITPNTNLLTLRAPLLLLLKIKEP